MKSLILSVLLITSSFSCVKEVEKIVTLEEKVANESVTTKDYYERHDTFPLGTNIIEYLGNDWVIIEIKNNKYLYRGKWLNGNGSSEVMVPYIETK